MHNINQEKPVVLVLSGHDPSGGAGIQADIESISGNGCYSASIITTLTTQNSSKFIHAQPQDPEILRKQIRLIMDDMEIAACKIGVIGDVNLVEMIFHELSDKNIPIVFDPVLRSSSEHQLTDNITLEKIKALLLPIVTLITPNSIEARKMTGKQKPDEAADKLIQYGCQNVLITGAHEKTESVFNTLYTCNESSKSFETRRLPGTFHGSGCTLSSAIAANLAKGIDLIQSIDNSTRYTWTCLNRAMTAKSGIKIPDRICWRINNFDQYE